jgi:5'/3'-nucleotidase SurE
VGWALLTNDDGVDSPALIPFARALAAGLDLRVVVPDRERSWIAKAITRFEPVSVHELEREGVPIWACSGYPADAVQLGIHGLFDTPPDLVISGINLGYNHGAGFLMSSGTVGAAVEAWVSGVPSIAFSTGAMTAWAEWRALVRSEEGRAGWERLAVTCAALVGRIADSGIGASADVVSVNLPFDADDSTPRKVTAIARVGYDRLFRHVGEGIFVHDFGGGFLHFDALDGTDVDAAHHGWVSITPIRLPQAAAVPDDVRAALER